MENFPLPTHGYIYCTIYYLSTNQSNIFFIYMCKLLQTLNTAESKNRSALILPTLFSPNQYNNTLQHLQSNVRSC